MMIYDKATEKDILSLVELRLAYLREDYGELSDEQVSMITDQLHRYYPEHLNKDLFVYICRDDDQIISCCFLCVSEKPANPSFISGKTGTVLNVYTKPEYRRKGIAGKCLTMLLEEAKALGLDYVELKATEDGYHLYKSLGFQDDISHYHQMKYDI